MNTSYPRLAIETPAERSIRIAAMHEAAEAAAAATRAAAWATSASDEDRQAAARVLGGWYIEVGEGMGAQSVVLRDVITIA